MMYLHIILGLLLLLIPAGALYWLDRKLLRTFLVSVARMGVQLLVLCLVVWVLFRFDSLWLCLLWLVLMTAVSALLLLRRTRLEPRRWLPAVSVGLFVGVLLTSGWMLFVALPFAHATEARWLVPVMALLLGHSVTSAVRGVSAYAAALRDGATQYEYLLGNGQSRFRALQPFVRRALQAVLAPTAANLSQMALFTMPLLLCGLFLGGVAPLNAFVATLLLTAACVASSVLSLLLALAVSEWGRSKR